MERSQRLARPLVWIGSSRKEYLEFPAKVQDNFGFELFLAQTGQHPPSAKPLRGLGSGTVELVDNFDGDTYRAVYTVRFESAVYVLHAFKEVQAGHQDPSERHRADQAAA
jgi:phage-related protein